MSRVCHDHSFLLTLALQTRTCIMMTLLIPIWSKFSLSLIKITVPYQLPMGSWLGIETSILVGGATKSSSNLVRRKYSKQIYHKIFNNCSNNNINSLSLSLPILHSQLHHWSCHCNVSISSTYKMVAPHTPTIYDRHLRHNITNK